MAVADFAGTLLIGMTWMLMVFSNFVSTSRILHVDFPYRIAAPLTVFYQCLFALTLLCHMRSIFGDPGKLATLVPSQPPPTFKNAKFCQACNFRWKPPRAHHCRKCGSCIYRMDHHCALIDNCVGIGNQKFFILFLLYAAILCSVQLLLLACSFFLWIVKLFERHKSFTWGSVILKALLLTESLRCLRKSTDYLFEQVDALETNSTLVESHQHTHGSQKDFWTHVEEVFGDRWSLWPFPTKPKLNLDFTETVFFDQDVLRHIMVERYYSETRSQDKGLPPFPKTFEEMQKNHQNASSPRRRAAQT